MEESTCNKEQWNGACCCNCAYHIEDFHHCTTTRPEGAENCVCSIHKGWICMAAEMGTAHSGWSEHGMCEMHTFPETLKKWREESELKKITEAFKAGKLNSGEDFDGKMVWEYPEVEDYLKTREEPTT